MALSSIDRFTDAGVCAAFVRGPIPFRPEIRERYNAREPSIRFAELVLFALSLPVLISQARAQPRAETNPDGGSPRQTVTNGDSGVSTSAAKRGPARATRFAEAPTIDGRLDEGIWRQAAVLKDFYQTEPGDNVKATHPTEVRIGYDASFLYIGIRASDEPGQVRSTVAKRDDLSGDDYVAVWLDTFNDQRRAYVLLFNPLGVQADGLFTEGRGIDFSVDVVMQSQGRVTDEGYAVEVAVPFTSLRYEAGPGKFWGAHVLRIVRHLDEWDTWMPLRRESRDFRTAAFTQFLEQAGRITGIENVGFERTLELIPTLALSETGRRVRPADSAQPTTNFSPDPYRFLNQPVRADPGLTAKVTLSSGVALDATLNSDFADVEADQLVVTANQRFPIFFEEKRPFFLEGVEVFQTPIKAVHTRTIIDPDFALKLTGKRARNSFGLMLASDNAPGNFTEEERNDPAIRPGIERFIDKNAFIGVLRLKHDVGAQSSVGLIATSYDFIERRNQLVGVDGRFTFNASTILTFQILGTTSRHRFYDPSLDQDVYRRGIGVGYFTQIERAGRRVKVSLTGRGYSPDYRADVGFTTQTNTNPWDLIVTYNSEPRENSRLISWSLSSGTRVQFDWRARMQYSFQAVRAQFNLRRQTYLKADIYEDYQRVFEEEYGPKRTASRPGAFVGEPERSTRWKGYTLEAGTSPTKKYAAAVILDQSWKAFDYDLGNGPRFPRVSPAALLDPAAPFDPGKGDTLDLNLNFSWQPTDSLRLSLGRVSSRLLRLDTMRTAYYQQLYSLRSAYQFTRSTFVRARADYDTLRSNLSSQLLVGWTPNPGTAFYAGYNDDVNRNGFNPFSGQFEPGLRRNARTFFIKASYLIRRAI